MWIYRDRQVQQLSDSLGFPAFEKALWSCRTSGLRLTYQPACGGCATLFCTKIALAPALGEPCAFLARPQSRLIFRFCMFFFVRNFVAHIQFIYLFISFFLYLFLHLYIFKSIYRDRERDKEKMYLYVSVHDMRTSVQYLYIYINNLNISQIVAYFDSFCSWTYRGSNPPWSGTARRCPQTCSRRLFNSFSLYYKAPKPSIYSSRSSSQTFRKRVFLLWQARSLLAAQALPL